MEGSRKVKIHGGNPNIHIFLRLFCFMLLVGINRGQKIYKDKYCLSQEWVFIFSLKYVIKKVEISLYDRYKLQCAHHT